MDPFVCCGWKLGRRPSLLCRALFHVCAWWTLGDLVTDCLTVRHYHQMCEEGSLPCWLWPLGAIFLALPTVVMTVMVYRCDGLPGGWSGDGVEMEWWRKVLYGPLYFLGAPLYGIYISGVPLYCGDTRDEARRWVKVTYTKLAEVVCEAAPQVVLSHVP